MLAHTQNLWSWLLKPGFARGAIWAVMVCLFSSLNDVFAKYLGERLDGIEIAFFRFFFTMVTVLPFMIKRGAASFHMTRPWLHFTRALIGAAAIATWIYGAVHLPLPDMTTFSFSQPLFFLPLATFFLGEHVGLNRWVATSIGFLGVIIVVHPGDEFNVFTLLPIGAALLFATLDLLAKKMIVNEDRLALLFYFGFWTTLIALIPALMHWQTPTLHELFILFLLGAGGNLLQLCLFQAFSATEASSLAPFRYVELIFAAFFNLVLWGELPKMATLAGAALIIASTLYLTYTENRRKK